MKTNQEIGKEIRQRLLAQAAANRTYATLKAALNLAVKNRGGSAS